MTSTKGQRHLFDKARVNQPALIVVESLTESALDSIWRTPLDLFCTPYVECADTRHDNQVVNHQCGVHSGYEPTQFQL